MRPLNKTQFARERGVSRARVYQWLEDGRIRELPDGEHAGCIDADEAHAALGAMLDQSKGIRRNGNITSVAPAPASAAVAAPDSASTSEHGADVRTPAAVVPASPAAAAAPAGPEAISPELPFGEGAARAPTDDAVASTASSGNRNDNYWEHKAKREEYESLLTQSKYWKEAGSLVVAAAVRREAAEQARALRNALEGIPDRIAQALDPAHPARAHKLVLDEIRKALHEFSDRLDRRAATAGASEPDRAMV